VEVKLSRAQAMDRALMLHRLADKKYFSDIVKAINTKDQKLFAETCKKAEIPEVTVKDLWKIVKLRQEGALADVW
jgi:transcription initiation factor IIF auxiliary subunit